MMPSRPSYIDYFEGGAPRTRPNGRIMLDNTSARERPSSPALDAARVRPSTQRSHRQGYKG